MDRQAFLDYLREPDRLDERSLGELLELIRSYPYAANVHLIATLKARQGESPQLDRLLEGLAAATFDRAHLFERLHAEGPVVQSREEDVLELRELDELELAPATTGTHATFEEMPSKLNRIEDAHDESEGTEEVSITMPAAGSLPPRRRTPSWVDLAVAYHGVIATTAFEGLASMQAQQLPESPDRFTDRAATEDRLRARLQNLKRRSIGESEDSSPTVGARSAVVSETLADLLRRQGKYGHAIRMYRRLMLLYPDKKTIFAGRIEELKQKV